jgi:hypothetical protein
VYNDTESNLDILLSDGTSTRVILEHRGWEKVLANIAADKRKIKRWGWASILGWFSEWTFWGSPRRVQSGVSASANTY